MLEYVFFHQTPTDLFVEFLKSKSLKSQVQCNNDVFEIKLVSEPDGDVIDEIEEEYDRLIAMNQELFFAENPPTAENFRMAGVTFSLKDGTTTSAVIRPELLARVLDVIDETELHELIMTVVDAVESPDERSFCQKIRSKAASFDDEEA